ncbi:MAG TPA: amidohydrolase [Gammaproteobacteria bacterium]|nr:amidohydrolase [Gammaproteobacteria bacterium]
MKRRHFISLLGASAMGLLGARYWPDAGFSNPCLDVELPTALREHELMQRVWADIDPHEVWDDHVHVVGAGDSDSGIYLNPRMQEILHPAHYVRFRFYVNAACADPAQGIDASAQRRLQGLVDAWPAGARFLLLAFDAWHDKDGRVDLTRSAFYIPNEYVRDLASQQPQRFGWIASVHPWREDAVEALHRHVHDGALAIKWLPQIQNIDPASPRCDAFYAALAETGLPLLVHAGHEYAVAGVENQELGHPLRLRRPLEHGVRVIVAHCATEGHGPDTDRGPHGPEHANFVYFARLMEDARFTANLYGEISGVTQINRLGKPLKTILAREDWHPRLLNGSDYPLPGVMPLFSMRRMEALGYIDAGEAAFLSQLRRYNVLLFDFALKRLMRYQGHGLAAEVFASRRILARAL